MVFRVLKVKLNFYSGILKTLVMGNVLIAV